jgi:hypothetical protein
MSKAEQGGVRENVPCAVASFSRILGRGRRAGATRGWRQAVVGHSHARRDADTGGTNRRHHPPTPTIEKIKL